MSIAQFIQANLFLFILLGALIVAIIVYEWRQKGQGGKTISALNASLLINQGAYLIDTRAPADYKKAHIAGAKNHPAEQFDAELKRIKASKDKPVIVYCQMGLSAKTQAQYLRDQGYQEVYVLSGGLQGWHEENLPTVKG